MTYGSNERGEAWIRLSPEEHEAFKAGRPVVKVTGDCRGMARIALKMTRPRRNADRFPACMGYEEGQRR